MDEIKFNDNIENEHEKNPSLSIFADSEIAATAAAAASTTTTTGFSHLPSHNHHPHQQFHIDADVEEDDDHQHWLQEAAYGDNEELYLEYMRSCLAQKMGFFRELYGERDNTIKVLDTVDYYGLIKHWRSGGFKRIVTMAGAGISTSAGIPDFRSPGTGLYDNLQSYNLPRPTAIFEIDYLLENPKPFFALAKDLYPGKCKPTTCHYFIKLLEEKGLLERHYTQNIDTLERIAGITNDKLVECHGTFHTNHCLKCRQEFSVEWMRERIFADIIPMCDGCGGLVKPDIVFFGESLPENFHILSFNDLAECDLLIIMGTSLEVQPFASLVERVNSRCVRLLINRDPVGKYSLQVHLTYNEPGNKRDIAILCDCDDGVMQLATDLGWEDDLHKLIEKENDRIDMNTVSRNMKNLDIANDAAIGDCAASTGDVPIANATNQMINDDCLPPKL